MKPRLAYCFFLFATAASICSDLLCDISIVGCFFPSFTVKYLKATTIRDAIGILGFSNVLIAFVYNSLDKTIMGLSYKDLLVHRYKEYDYCSMAHAVATLVCIITSSAGKSESAAITFSAVIYGFYYQWNVFRDIILDAEKQEELANCVWQSRFATDTSFLKHLLCLADTPLIPYSKHYQSHLNNISQAFTKFVTNNNVHIDSVVAIWNKLLTSSNNDIMIAANIFKKSFESDLDSCSILVCGFVAQQIEFHTDSSVESSVEVVLTKVSQTIARLINQLLAHTEGNSNEEAEKAVQSVVAAMQKCFLVYLWVLFQCGEVSLSSDLYFLKNNCEKDYEPKCLYSMICYLRPQLNNDNGYNYINRALAQLK